MSLEKTNNTENFDGEEFECYMQEMQYYDSWRSNKSHTRWVLKNIPTIGIPENMSRSTGKYRLVRVKVIETSKKIPFISNDGGL